jgi:hypothetical protein
MSSEKTIDVMDGDTWTMWPRTSGMYQYRNGAYRFIDDTHISPGWRSLTKDPVEVSIPDCAAKAILASWGYKITPGEGEKPKCQPKTTSPVLTAERTENPPTVKPELTVDAIKAVVREMMEGYSATDHNAMAFIRTLQTQVENLESRLAALASAIQPAARVVKAPGRPVYGDGDWRKGVEWEAKRWRAALAEAGIAIADDNSTQH